MMNSSRKRFDLIALLDTIGKWRRLIILNLIIFALLSIVISLMLPRWYKATASILPPKEQGLLSAFGFGSSSSVGSAVQSLLKSSNLSGLGQDLGAYNYLAILQSRTAMEAVIRKYDLMREYRIKDSSMEKAVKKLRDNTEFTVEDEGYISLYVWDTDPVRAAGMTNYFIDMLNQISVTLGVEDAKNIREFLENRLDQSRLELREAEDSLRDYQEKSGVLAIPGEYSASIIAAAELYASRTKDEVELSVLKQTLSGDAPSIRQKESEIAALDQKLSNVPEVEVKSLRLYRNLAIKEKIVEYLVPIYEQAKINEQKDVPVILVLDKAAPPEKVDKPSRMLIVFIGILISLMVSYFIILIKEFITATKRDRPDEWNRFRESLRILRKLHHT